jgi:hypothetical protein
VAGLPEYWDGIVIEHAGSEVTPNGRLKYFLRVFHDGVQIQDDWIHISEPVIEAAAVRVELVPVAWPTKLAREMLDFFRGRDAPADPAVTAAADTAQTPDECLALLRQKLPQPPDEGPSAYARRLYKHLPPRFSGHWGSSEVLRVRLYHQDQAKRR